MYQKPCYIQVRNPNLSLFRQTEIMPKVVKIGRCGFIHSQIKNKENSNEIKEPNQILMF